MTRKIAISVPDDVADRLDRESNVSAFITDAVRRRMMSEDVRDRLAHGGFTVTEEDIADAATELGDLHAGVTPRLQREASQLRELIARGQPW
jgi:hypothetical protein